MVEANRTYSKYADSTAIQLLDQLLACTDAPEQYRNTMYSLGQRLGNNLNDKVAGSSCMVVSTAEDADFLSKGIIESISKSAQKVYAGVFWNNHYQISKGNSVAPVIHKYLQPGFQKSKTLVVAKSVMSGSCVVRSNILELIENLELERIFILSPVMHEKAERNLIAEFPENISARFEFVYFAKDIAKDEVSGEVKPGIGGMVYKLLGISDQPVKVGYVPQLVREYTQEQQHAL